jgi:putative ABC transport system ATP-binding protein
MIRCVDVHKSYATGGHQVAALRGVDMNIDEPGFYAVMGASGSGKSTLLHLLSALDTPDAGEVHIAGERIDQLDDRALTRFRRRGVGVVFQSYNLIPTLTARENVELPGVIAGEPASRLRKRSAELLEALGVAERADHRPEAMSGGEQQRVAIARSLVFDPPVLLADEPTGNLDSRSSDRLWRLLGDLAGQRKMTVLMVTHEPAAAAHCRSVYILADGRISGTFQTEGLDASGVAARYQQSAG